MATRKNGGQISEMVIEQLQEIVHAGAPWKPTQQQPRGYSDLIYLITGHLYFPEFIRDNGDIETATEIWAELREDILVQHARQQRPVLNRIFDSVRPWAWWALEDREGRRRLDRKTCSCFPTVECPYLPPGNLSWFGHRRGCRCEYESEKQYLKRLSSPEEKRIER